MDKIDKVRSSIQKAKTSYVNMKKNSVPGEELTETEGVDMIPLGGESLIETPENKNKEKST